MPLYIGDYLGDTQRLTTEQHGAYLLLLMDYWRNGPPPADDAVLAQIARLSLPAWRKLKPAIVRFFTERDGHFRHGRVDKELAKASENQERRSAKAKKAADARWNGDGDASSNAKSNAPGMLQAMPVECPLPSPSSEDKSSGVPPADPVKAMFDLGVSILMAAGRTEKASRTLVGKWRGMVGDPRCAELLMLARGKTEPVEWMEKAIAGRAEQEDGYLDHIERKYA
jgi:uncharacterized protein YdaU (DUF1376 family)